MAPVYPNPFNHETVVEYGLSEETMVNLSVFNILGQRVQVLVNNLQTPGFKRATWNGQNRFGSIVSSGLYFVRLQAGSQVMMSKVLLQK